MTIMAKFMKTGKLYFEWKVFIVTIKRIRPVVWLSLLFVVLGAINYEGKIITISNSNSLITGLNAVLYQILIAYFTGFVIYFLFELLSRTRKRIAISTSVGNNVLLMHERVEFLMNEIGKRHVDAATEFDLSEDNMHKCCEVINIDSEVVQVWYYPDYSFRSFVTKSCEDIQSAAEEIKAYSDSLDEEWIYSLSKVSGLATKIIRSLHFRFPQPRIEFYYLWGLYAEAERLMILLNKFDKDVFNLSKLSAPPFHPKGLMFRVNRKK